MFVSSISCFHPLWSYGKSPQWLPCPSLLGFVAKLICFSLCLCAATVEIHAIDENLFNDRLIGKRKWILCVRRA